MHCINQTKPFLNPTFSGTGPDSLNFEITREGVIVEEQTFTDAATALAWFDDMFVDLMAELRKTVGSYFYRAQFGPPEPRRAATSSACSYATSRVFSRYSKPCPAALSWLSWRQPCARAASAKSSPWSASS